MDGKMSKMNLLMILCVFIILIGCGQGGGSGAGNFGNGNDTVGEGNNFSGDNSEMTTVLFAANEIGGSTVYAVSDSFKLILGEADDFVVFEKNQDTELDVVLWNEGLEPILE